jgi:hypothetical protein
LQDSGIFNILSIYPKNYRLSVCFSGFAMRTNTENNFQIGSEERVPSSMGHKIYSLLSGLFCILMLSGCAAPSPTDSPTLVPTIAIATTYPALEPKVLATAYPAVSGDEKIADYPYPVEEGGPGPAGVPARDNRSRVTAKLIEQAPDSDNPDLIRLHVLVTGVADIEGMPNMAGALLNQESDLFVQKDLLVDLQPEQVFTADISFRGDEHGAKYYIMTFLP